MRPHFDVDRLATAERRVREQLLGARVDGAWSGHQSSSPLATASALLAFQAAGKQDPTAVDPEVMARGLVWLAASQNDDGGWGDAGRSRTTLLSTVSAVSALKLCGTSSELESARTAGLKSMRQAGGPLALLEETGPDRTISAPVLIQAAASGLIDWKEVPSFPFEWTALPTASFGSLRLPVASYGLPILIAAGQTRHHFHRPWNAFHGWLRDLCLPRSLRILRRSQPENGGFADSIPLTAFVVFCLSVRGVSDHAVVHRGLEFLRAAVRADGSWPLATPATTWLTALACEGIGETLPESDRNTLRESFRSTQQRSRHPLTQVKRGGWSASGSQSGLPDAWTTASVLTADTALNPDGPSVPEEVSATSDGVEWLLDLQKEDFGWSAFALHGQGPADESAPELTAHVLRSLSQWRDRMESASQPASERVTKLCQRCDEALTQGLRFLAKSQRPDGAWVTNWFGDPDAAGRVNFVWGTAWVAAAYHEMGRHDALPARDGLRWLRTQQNTDGGWGGRKGSPSRVNETAVAIHALLWDREGGRVIERGLNWLVERIESGTIDETNASAYSLGRVWYREDLFPLLFTARAMSHARRCLAEQGSDVTRREDLAPRRQQRGAG